MTGLNGEYWSEDEVAAIIKAKDDGKLSSDKFVEILSLKRFTSGYIPQVNGHDTDAYVSGTWNTFEQGFYRNQITDEEFAKVADRYMEYKDDC